MPRLQDVGARIAVAMHAVEQVAVLVKQREIDRPGVHTNARDHLTARSGSSNGELQTLERFAPQADQIPIQPTTDGYGSVWESVQDFNLELPVFEPAECDTTAARAEINCDMKISAHTRLARPHRWSAHRQSFCSMLDSQNSTRPRRCPLGKR